MGWAEILGVVPTVCTFMKCLEESMEILHLSKSQTASVDKAATCQFQEITSNRILHGRAGMVVIPFILSHRSKNGQPKKLMAFMLSGKLCENQMMCWWIAI